MCHGIEKQTMVRLDAVACPHLLGLCDAKSGSTEKKGAFSSLGDEELDINSQHNHNHTT